MSEFKLLSISEKSVKGAIKHVDSVPNKPLGHRKSGSGQSETTKQINKART
jgi:hypothetical protein